MSLRGLVFWAKRVQMMHGFVSWKDGSALEAVMLVAVKARDPFLPSQKKIGPILNLEVG